MSRFKGFTRIAAGFDPMEIRLAATALDGAGFVAITSGLAPTETMPMNSLAFGPIELHVPADDAEDARNLLEAIADGTMIRQDPPEPLDDPDEASQPPRKGRLGNLLGFLVAGVSQPLRGLSVDRRRRRFDEAD